MVCLSITVLRLLEMEREEKSGKKRVMFCYGNVTT
jgi:hypothetical protein